MKTTEIHRVLRSLRWRMAIRGFLESWVRATLFFFGVLVVLWGAAWWMGRVPNPADIPIVLAWPFLLGATGALVLAVVRFPSLERAALLGDRLGATHDRLFSALEFLKMPHPSELETLAIGEVEEHLRGRDFRAFLPIRPPHDLLWLAVPVAMLAMLWWDAMQSAATRELRAAVETAKITATAKKLEHFAEQLDKKADAADEARLKFLSRFLKQSAEQMRAEAAGGGDAQKAALRELSMIEQLVKELRQPETATPEELKALAEALGKHEQTREAATDMRAGNLADAAKKLADAAQRHDALPDEQVRKIIQQALDHLAQNQGQLSKEMEQLRNHAKANDGKHQDLLQQIADMLSGLQQQGNVAEQNKGKAAEKKGVGKPMDDDDLKMLLGALENLKNSQQGEAPSDGETREEEGEPRGPIAMLDFRKGTDVDHNADGNPNIPTGQPGDDKDKGTTESPFGKLIGGPKDATQKDQLSGRFGEGESLSALIPGATTGGEKAARRYKELYEAASSDAEDAVAQENIPLGSRFLIKRYFEAIRPKQ